MLLECRVKFQCTAAKTKTPPSKKLIWCLHKARRTNSNERKRHWKIHITPWQSAVESPRKRNKKRRIFIKFRKLATHTYSARRQQKTMRRESDIQISLVGQIDVKLGPFTCSWCKIDWIAVTFVFRDKKKLNFAWWKMLTRDIIGSANTRRRCHGSFMCLMPRRRRRHHWCCWKSIVAVIMNVW